MTVNQKRDVKKELVRRLFWIAIVAISLAPFFPIAMKTLGEQSELRGRLAASQVSVLKYYIGERVKVTNFESAASKNKYPLPHI